MSDSSGSDDIPDELQVDLSSRQSWTLRIASFVLLAIIIGGGYFFRPWFHGVVYFVYTTPSIWVVTAALVAIFGYAFVTGANDRAAKVVTGLAVFVIVGFVVASLTTGLYAAEELSDDMMSSSPEINNLSDVSGQQPRIVPEAVGYNYAQNTLDRPQYKAADPDVTFINDTPHWSIPLSPDGFRNHYVLKQGGTAYVDMTEQNAKVNTTNTKMDAGIGTAFYNNYKWHTLKKGNYLADYEDPYMVPHNGETYMAVPYIQPEFHMRWAPIPTPYTTPEWGGVALIAPNGTVTDLSPQEARNHPVLKGQKLVPFDLTKQRVTATRFRNGIVNTLPLVGAHADEIEVAPTPGEGNDQPYLMSTQNGAKYVVAAEPYGNAQGLKEVWEIDSRTGQAEVYESPAGESLFGPRKASNYVRQAARTTDWDRFTPSEPLPTVINGQLYWMVRVVPNDATGVSYVAFVNAQSSDVREMSQTGAVSSFLTGETGAGTVVASSNESSGPSSNVSVIVRKRNDNGTVVSTMRVYENESVAIQPAAGNGSEQPTTGNATTTTGT